MRTLQSIGGFGIGDEPLAGADWVRAMYGVDGDPLAGPYLRTATSHSADPFPLATQYHLKQTLTLKSVSVAPVRLTEACEILRSARPFFESTSWARVLDPSAGSGFMARTCLELVAPSRSWRQWWLGELGAGERVAFHIDQALLRDLVLPAERDPVFYEMWPAIDAAVDTITLYDATPLECFSEEDLATPYGRARARRAREWRDCLRRRGHSIRLDGTTLRSCAWRSSCGLTQRNGRFFALTPVHLHLVEDGGTADNDLPLSLRPAA